MPDEDPSRTVSGYSTQAQVSLDVATIINNGRIRFWFSIEFNPIENNSASNPLKIFEELDLFHKTGNRGLRKANALADNLRLWIQRCAIEGLIYHEQRGLALHAVKSAPEQGGFAPRVFYLRRIPGPFEEREPNEYRVENEPIVNGRAHQIIPPMLG